MRVLGTVLAACGWLLATAASALAISAPIHIANTGGEGVFIRPEPNTSHPALGWIPEGASPDYNCFAWGQDINGVPIWFNVNYNGKTGYYASYYDDSSYHSNEELTAKYRVPLCGSAPSTPSPQAPPTQPPASTPPASNPPAQPPASTPPASATSPPSPIAVYFNPYGRHDRHGAHEVGDGLTHDLPRGGKSDWYGGCKMSRRSYEVATSSAKGHPVATLSGWSLGRLGILSFLASATVDQLKQLNYVLLIDPGQFGGNEMKCDRRYSGGDPYVRWLHVNESAHLVVISGSLSQREHSRGIQEVYFNDMREGPYPSVTSRVLVCNYPVDHQQAFWSSRYWIQHQIGSTSKSCPWLKVAGHWKKASAGWHP